MKTEQRPFSLSFRVLFLVAGFGFLLVPGPVLAGGGEAVVIKKIYISRPSVDPTLPKNQTEEILQALIAEMAGSLRFDLALQPGGADTGRVPMDRLLKLALQSGSDTLVVTSVKRAGASNIVSIGLVTVDTGKYYALERALIKKGLPPGPVVAEAARRLIARIPYRARVESAQGGKVVLDAGMVNGLGKGASVTVFRIRSVNRHPFTGEIIGFEREEIARLRITDSREMTSEGTVAKQISGIPPAAGDLVGFEPDPQILAGMKKRAGELIAERIEDLKPAARKPVAAKPRPKPAEAARPAGLNRFSLEAGAGVAWESARFRSNGLNINRDVTPYAFMSVGGEGWFLPSFGLDGHYEIGKVKFSSGDPSFSDVYVTTTLAKAHLLYRRMVRAGTTPVILKAGGGYAIYHYKPDKTDDSLFIDTKYSGPQMVLGSDMAWTNRFNNAIRVEFQPVLSVHESPVTSGSGSSGYSISAEVDGAYRFKESWIVGVQYRIRRTEVNFNGAGTRAGGIAGAGSHETLQTVQLYLGYSD